MPTAASGDSIDEMLIMGHLQARLLGLTLLTIEAYVTVSPADANLPLLVRPRRDVRRRTALRRAFRRQRPSPTERTGTGRRRLRTAEATDRVERGSRPRSGGVGLARSAELVQQATTALDEVGAH